MVFEVHKSENFCVKMALVSFGWMVAAANDQVLRALARSFQCALRMIRHFHCRAEGGLLFGASPALKNARIGFVVMAVCCAALDFIPK
jgi:hypothetical protein